MDNKIQGYNATLVIIDDMMFSADEMPEGWDSPERLAGMKYLAMDFASLEERVLATSLSSNEVTDALLPVKPYREYLRHNQTPRSPRHRR